MQIKPTDDFNNPLSTNVFLTLLFEGARMRGCGETIVPFVKKTVSFVKKMVSFVKKR